MSAQEPVESKEFISSFKGFMDKVVSQAPGKEPVFVRHLRAHFVVAGVTELRLVHALAFERDEAHGLARRVELQHDGRQCARRQSP